MSLSGESVGAGDQKHLEQTAGNTRENVLAKATVVKIQNVSDTIKKLTLNVDCSDGHFSFKAGQWVDFFITNVETVGGYSMCSAPRLLLSKNLLELAVKFSHHPPAFWVHDKCKEGSQVSLRVGGDFFYDPLPTAQSDLLLIAGGVGINPILSIMRHVMDINEDRVCDTKTHMLYSASSQKELVFRDTIEDICSKKPSLFERQFFVTQEKVQSSNSVMGRRITVEDIGKSLAELNKNSVQCFICGPSSFIDSMELYLTDVGLRKEQIHYEKWW